METPEGFYFIRIMDTAPAEKIPFEKAYEEIERELRSKAIKERKEKYIRNLKESAVIQIQI